MASRTRVMTFMLMLALSLPLYAHAEDSTYKTALIIYGENAAPAEQDAAVELVRDLAKVYSLQIVLLPAKPRSAAPETAVFYVGTPDTNSMIRNFVESGVIRVSSTDPGPEAFVIKGLPASGEVIIAGCDARGTLYGVYKFSEQYLGIDPMAYWTGKEPERRDALVIPEIDFRASPPAFALRGYFDNDSDMLANFSGRKLVIEFELWREMIDSLARLGYNFIDPFDTLGRTEFWVWPYYTEKFPGYHTDLELVERIITYAHSKGMMVQVSTYLGYEFLHLPYEKKCLSRYHDDWIETYRRLLEETPIGRADIFYHSPRDPWWDHPYYCVPELLLGINPAKLHTRLINDLDRLIDEHNPDARLMCLFWSDGKKHWESGAFKPNPGIDMVWADDGYGRYPQWPGDFRGYDFGIYIHAGFWKNHVLQDPYPERLAASIKEARARGMDNYIFVNGQDFKHFILNLEAAGRLAWDPEDFDPEEFYLTWTTRYFGVKAAPLTVESLKALHRAHDLAGGFADLTMKTKAYLKLVRYGVPYCRDYSDLEPALTEASRALELAGAARESVPESSRLVFDDQILFPAKIYLVNLELHADVAGIINERCRLLNPLASPKAKAQAVKRIEENKKNAPGHLKHLVDLLEAGSGWDKWAGWTRVENFRKYEPPPTMDELEKSLGLRP